MTGIDISPVAVERRVAHLRFVYGADNQDAAMLEAQLAEIAAKDAEIAELRAVMTATKAKLLGVIHISTSDNLPEAGQWQVYGGATGGGTGC